MMRAWLLCRKYCTIIENRSSEPAENAAADNHSYSEFYWYEVRFGIETIIFVIY